MDSVAVAGAVLLVAAVAAVVVKMAVADAFFWRTGRLLAAEDASVFPVD